jgi:hypothetical protein
MTSKTATYHIAHEELMQMANTGMIGFSIPENTETLIVKTEKYNSNAEFDDIELEPLPALAEEEIVEQYFAGLNIPYREVQRYIIADYLTMILRNFKVLNNINKANVLEVLQTELEEQKIHHANITDVPDDFDKQPF